MPFHAQLGSRVRTSEAVDVASSLFFEGIELFGSGQLDEALLRFQQAAAINQKYLLPSARELVLCYNNMGAVHDRLGNLEQAVGYYERARQLLSSPDVPREERSLMSRRRRGELLKHVERKLAMMPRTAEPKVGAGVPVGEVRALMKSMWAEAEAQAARSEWQEALASYNIVLTLARQGAGSGGVEGLRSSAETLARMGAVLLELGDVPKAREHFMGAVTVLRELEPAEAQARLAARAAPSSAPPSPPMRPPPYRPRHASGGGGGGRHHALRELGGTAGRGAGGAVRPPHRLAQRRVGRWRRWRRRRGRRRGRRRRVHSGAPAGVARGGGVGRRATLSARVAQDARRRAAARPPALVLRE